MSERTDGERIDGAEVTDARPAAPLGIDRRPRGARRLAIAVAVVLLAWLAGLVAFVQAIPRAVDDPHRHTDAIVVLTGGSNRIDVGLRLLKDGQATAMLVSGVDRTVDANAIRALVERNGEDLPKALLACCIRLGYGAEDTIGNAAETARWMREGRYRSLRLVTSNYHMARSLLELRHALPGVEIVPHPVVPNDVRLSEWWVWPGTLKLLAMEFNKYLAATARLSLGLSG